jgi:glucose dehydrogenase
MARPAWLRGLFLACALATLAASPPTVAPPPREWRTHGGDPGHTQYSALDQINAGNVRRLKTAWTYRAGDANDRSQIQ